MAQQDFEHFKQEIKDWLDSHPEEYDRFVGEVNETCSQANAQVSDGMSR